MQNLKRFFLLYIIGGLTAVSLFWAFYSQRMFKALEHDIELRAHLYGGYLKYITQNESPQFLENLIFEKVIEEINFPVVVTDAKGNLLFYRNISPKDTAKEKIQKIIKRLDKERNPVELFIRVNKDTVLQYVHFGMPESYRMLKFFPIVQFVFIGIFIIFGFLLLFLFIKGEQDRLWTMFAKETAHQLGTPLSSISGWMEVAKEKLDEDIIKEMSKDVERMREIVDRFSRIGKVTKKEEIKIDEVLKDTVEFIKKRAPSNIEFIKNIQPSPKIVGDRVLLSWVFENIIKNSIDAIGKEKGRIEINGIRKERNYTIFIKDTGRGIEKRIISRLFSSGFSTKPYGWGMGLSLAKRVIEKYHKGKIKFTEVSKGKTTILILIPLK